MPLLFDLEGTLRLTDRAGLHAMHEAGRGLRGHEIDPREVVVIGDTPRGVDRARDGQPVQASQLSAGWLPWASWEASGPSRVR